MRQARRPRPMQRSFSPDMTLDQLRAAQGETPFQAGVVQEARMLKWRVLWVRPVRVQRGEHVYYETPFGGDGVGWPDLVIAREVVLYRELKSARGHLDPAQEAWRDVLIGAGQSWDIWKPADHERVSRELSHRWYPGFPPVMRRCGNEWCCPKEPV